MIIKFFIFIIIMLSFINIYCAQTTDIYLSLSISGMRSDIVLEDFSVLDRNENSIKYSVLLKKIIENDLILSRYFNVIKDSSENLKLSFKEKLFLWKKMGVSVLLIASVSCNDEDISLEINMLDVITGEKIWKCAYKNKFKNYRYMAHEISDEIVRRFTGEIGIARSKIVFVNNSTGFKELYIVDYDGYNLRRLTKDNKINILPKCSPNGNSIIYTSYLYNNPDLFYLDLIKNTRSIISKHQGLNASASFTPDGKKILVTLSMGRYPNLYLININGEMLQRITKGSYIDTSPSFAPNGQEVVFVSDRSGYPQLYIMNIDGGNIRRLTTSGFCDSPAWSPHGDKIVFTMRQLKGNYDLYIYDLPTAKTTKLTSNQKNNENPTWSPDGRFIVFYSNRSGNGEIYIMSIDGLGIRKLVEIPGTSYTPSWSPIFIK